MSTDDWFKLLIVQQNLFREIPYRTRQYKHLMFTAYPLRGPV